MKLLIFTQKIDRNDPVLGFFHGWIVEFAKRFESVTAICLEKGESDLPTNVKVLSLGKEEKHSRIQYVTRFYHFIWQERRNYDAVFVHMNEEYILLGGLIWAVMAKKVYMWRNHHAGSILTDLAAFFSSKVFCTSKYSYTAKYKKTVLMPVGINTDIFMKQTQIAKTPKSILFLGRIAPVKKPDLLIEALKEMNRQGIDFQASIYGNPIQADRDYYGSLKNNVNEVGLTEKITFYPGVLNTETVEIYNRHQIFVNLSSSGMYDKTIFEAMACETQVLASNRNLHGLVDEQYIFTEDNRDELTEKLISLLNQSADRIAESGSHLRNIVLRNHSLRELSAKLVGEIIL